MSFTPAHSAAVLYALETTLPPDLLDDGTMQPYPAVPSAPVVLGYTNLPQNGRGLNNSKGFAVGQQGAAYNKRGGRTPNINVSIRPGNVAALVNLFPGANDELPFLAIYVVVKGQYTIVYRHCKPSTVDFNFGGGGEGGGGELTIGANFMAIDRQEIGPLIVTRPQMRALGTPLMWHDVRKFNITDHEGNSKNYRRTLMNLTCKADYGTERKNSSPFYGDNATSSITSFDLLEHHQKIDGEISLHDRLPKAMFEGAARAQDWGDIIVHCADVEAAKGFDLTLAGAFPSDDTMQGAESSAEIDFNVPFTADAMTLALI